MQDPTQRQVVGSASPALTAHREQALTLTPAQLRTSCVLLLLDVTSGTSKRMQERPCLPFPSLLHGTFSTAKIPLTTWGSACRCLGRNQTFRRCFCQSGSLPVHSGPHTQRRNDDAFAHESTFVVKKQESTPPPSCPILKCLYGTGNSLQPPVLVLVHQQLSLLSSLQHFSHRGPSVPNLIAVNTKSVYHLGHVTNPRLQTTLTSAAPDS